MILNDFQSEMISAEVNIDGKSMKIANKHPLLVTLFGPYSTESWTVPLMYGR